MFDTPIRRRSVPLCLVGVAALVMSACGSDDAATPVTPADPAGNGGAVVMASTSIWADVTSEVACGELEVGTLIPVGVDAHDYELSVRDAEELRSADLIVVNGLFLEEGLEGALSGAAEGGVTVLEVGDVVTLIETDDDHSHDKDDDHSHDDDHSYDKDDDHSHDDGGVDPHVWMDPMRVAEAVPGITEALVALDDLPVDAEQVEACAQQYIDSLEELSKEMAEAFTGLEPRSIVTNHEALGYLADAFDIDVVGTVIPSTSTLGEANARDLDELADTMREAGVTRIFGEVTGASDVAAALADRMGDDVEVVELYTESLGGEGSGAETYLDMMRTNTTLIVGTD